MTTLHTRHELHAARVNRGRRFLTAEWRHLVMLNYLIDASCLRRLVPRGTEVDSWNGRTFISLVGFRFINTRVCGISIPFHRNFDEVNLRFYVRREARDGWRRGVVFVKEIVARFAIAAVARRWYNENYVVWPMNSYVKFPDVQNGVQGVAEYGWKIRDTHNFIRAKFDGMPEYPAPGSEEEFITEHYWGYTVQRDGGTVEYAVEHPPWRVWRASASQLHCDVVNCYGTEFQTCLHAPPVSAFVADGSAVTVYRGSRLPD